MCSLLFNREQRNDVRQTLVITGDEIWCTLTPKCHLEVSRFSKIGKIALLLEMTMLSLNTFIHHLGQQCF